jgi:hypothetical protein
MNHQKTLRIRVTSTGGKMSIPQYLFCNEKLSNKVMVLNKLKKQLFAKNGKD